MVGDIATRCIGYTAYIAHDESGAPPFSTAVTILTHFYRLSTFCGKFTMKRKPPINFQAATYEIAPDDN